jgi:hypothetical protein
MSAIGLFMPYEPEHTWSEEVLVKVGPTISNSIGGVLITLDGSVSQTHARTAQVTEHPVEDGSDVTDHVRIDPIRVTINGIVTSTVLGQQGEGGREVDAWAALEAILEDRQPVTVTTTLRTYESMILASISTPRDASLAHAVAPVLEFRQVRIVKSQTTTLPPERIPAPAQKASAPATKDAGKQATDPPTAAQTEKSRSLLLSLGAAAGIVVP